MDIAVRRAELTAMHPRLLGADIIAELAAMATAGLRLYYEVDTKYGLDAKCK